MLQCGLSCAKLGPRLTCGKASMFICNMQIHLMLDIDPIRIYIFLQLMTPFHIASIQCNAGSGQGFCREVYMPKRKEKHANKLIFQKDLKTC